MRLVLRFVAVVGGCGLLALASSSAWAIGDEGLPNFNAPVDNSPLNVDKVNRTLGVPMFKESSLWNEDDIFVAKRLAWPEESRTSTQSSYRLYPSEKNPVTIMGTRAYSCVFYATHGNPTEVSIVFVNEGDYGWVQAFMAEYRKRHPESASDTAANTNSNTNAAQGIAPEVIKPAKTPSEIEMLHLGSDERDSIDKKVQDDFEQALKQDTQNLTDAVTKLFGNPVHEGFGGGSETRERVLRWDWQGHSFLLSSPKDKYVTLRIVPVALAEHNGTTQGIERDDLKALLLQRVKRAESGDVVVSDIPMVDQGPKGYCVPATWQRYLRFLGIPADMYVLAAAGGTSPRGTDLDAMVANVDSLVTLYHRKIDTFNGDLDMKMITRNIDGGFPIMWNCDIHIPFEKALMCRKVERGNVTDWKAWAAQLAENDKTEIPDEIAGTPVAGGHQRMIIGYNAKTGEIAISDSWSKAFEIRWLTLNEANAINLGQSYVIGL